MSKENKLLTEKLGKCWHENFNEYLLCNKCEAPFRLNFSEWETFGKLFEWAQQQVWWQQFGDLVVYSINNMGESKFGKNMKICELEWFIHPDRFADALYQFLKEKE